VPGQLRRRRAPTPPARTRRPASRARRRGPTSPALKRALGAAVLLVAAAAIALAYLKPSFSSGQTVRMMFDNVQGLGVVDRDVEVAGTPVGQITGVSRRGDHALVSVSIQPSIVVHDDATAELRPHLPFEGTAYIDLQPGSPGAPRLGDAILPLSRTSVYVPLFHALSVFQAPTRAATRADAGELAQTLAGQGIGGIQGTLRGAPELTATLAPAAAAAQGPHGTELAGAIAGLAATVAGLDRHQSQLEPLVREATATMQALGTQATRPLGLSLQELPGTLSSLDFGSRALDGLVLRLRPLAAELSPGLGALSPALSQTEPLLLAAAPTLRGAPPLLARLRAALAEGAIAAPASDGLLRTLSPSLTLLQRSLLPALLAPTAHLGVPAYLSFITLFQGGGGASAPFQTPAQASQPGQLGVGHFMRFGARFFTGLGGPLPPCTLVAKVSQQLASELAANGICQS
jgi:ABC-type transporter Mla subunit MlaD